MHVEHPFGCRFRKFIQGSRYISLGCTKDAFLSSLYICVLLDLAHYCRSRQDDKKNVTVPISILAFHNTFFKYFLDASHQMRVHALDGRTKKSILNDQLI